MARKNRKPSAAVLPAAPIPMPRQVGHTRARVSVDTPDFLQGFGGFGSLSAPNYEAEWRTNQYDDQTLDRIDTPELLLRLADLSPEVSRGLWDFLRFCNAGWEVKVFRQGGSEEVEDKRGAAAIDLFLSQIKHLYGSVDVVINRLFISAYLRGAFFAEVVLDQAGRLPVDIATPDPRWVLFERRSDPVRGVVFVPFQQQGGKRVYLDRETLRYVPVDPVPGSPFGRALASPAVFTTLFSLGLLRDLRRVISQQGYPRLDITLVGENMAKWAPASVKSDPAEMKRWVDALIADIRDQYAQLQPDSVWIHTDSSTLGKNNPVDASSLSAIDGLMKALERSHIRALKSAPFLFGSSESTTETQSNRQYEALIAGFQALQHLCEHLIEHLLTIALQVQGIQGQVKWRFSVVRASELMRDAQAVKQQYDNEMFAYLAGWKSQQESCMEATGKDKPDQEEPRALPSGFALEGAQPAGVVEPGANRSLPLAEARELYNAALDHAEGQRLLALATNGNGKHEG